MYIPLRVFSPFSVGFGAVRAEQIADFCKEHDIPAAGITDHNTLGGALSMSKQLAARGIQPLVGLTIDVSFSDTTGTLVLFATNQSGYSALLRVANHRNTAADPAPLPIHVLAEKIGHDAGSLMALTGGKDGLLDQMIASGQKIQPACAELVTLFGADRIYVEIQRHSAVPGTAERTLLQAARHFSLPLVATNEAHYANSSDTEAHDAFLCISDKTVLADAARRHARNGQYLVDPQEMKERFADLPEAIANTVEIARRAAFMVEPAEPRLPAYVSETGESEADALRRMAAEGLKSRLSRMNAMEGHDENDYFSRLETELGIIIRMDFPGYFLIVADFIGWARANGIPVGPGRGSGAGSLVAWALGITDIDPIRFGLIFERFLNPERISMPDFDIDFCQERRDEVIDYVRSKYGSERVAHIAAFGTLQARAVVRDVARVMQVPYPVADRFAKMIPANPSNPITLAEAMEQDALAEAIREAGDDIKAVFRIALQLEGLYRHVSTHAAGIIISDRPVADVVPVHLDQNGKLATSFEMKAVEAAGLVKFDFLGLKNLDIIQGALDFIEQSGKGRIDLSEVGFEDDRTYAGLAGGDGFGVFQLESAGMRQAMQDLQVSNIEELIALISLYRPGPMDQIKTYAAVKRGDEEVHYDHPETREVLEPTNGVMIYQEQVMEIARRLAGYTPGEADVLRRAMGKKIQSEMDAQKARFQDGAAAGWTMITLDDGSRRRVHALSRFPALDGSGRTVTITQAIEEKIEVAL